MGLPSGVLWAPCNIDVSQPDGFATSPFKYDCSFFSWGNVDGHNPTGPASFSPWDWGGINAQAPWYDGQVYGETPGNTLESNIPVDVTYDAALSNVGQPWRIPTVDDFTELLSNAIFIRPDGSAIDPSVVDKRVTVDGVVGVYLQSTVNGNRLFFACCGYGNGSVLSSRGIVGGYWSSIFYNARYGRRLNISNSEVNPNQSGNRYNAFTIRPVMTL